MRSLLKLYEGQCLIVLGQYKRGTELMRVYQQFVSRDKGRRAVSAQVDRSCPLIPGKWRVVLRRFVARTRPLLTMGAVEQCKVSTKVVERVVSQHRTAIISDPPLREVTSRGFEMSVGCLSKQRSHCDLMLHYWTYAASLYRGTTISPALSARLKENFLGVYPMCRP